MKSNSWALLLIFLFVPIIRSALIVATVVPLALLGAFAMLDVEHIPANLISLGAIDFGIIVDSAVVVIENILRLLEEDPNRRKYLTATIIRAVTQMGKPILFSKAILITAFIPLYTMQEVEGRIFRPMALTLTFALIAGMILALTLVPVLASFALATKLPGKESWIVRILHATYEPLLKIALRLHWLFLICAVGLVIIAGFVLSNIGMEFLPKLDEGSLWVRCFMPKTISPSEAIHTTREIRQVLANFPEVRNVISQLGQPDDGTDVNGWDVVEYSVDVNPNHDEWTTAHDRDGLCNAMKVKIDASVPGIDTEFSQNIEDNVNEAVSGLKGELGVKIFGQDPAKLQDISDRIAAILPQVPGVTDVWAGSFENQQRAMARLEVIVPITLALIFFLLLSAFNSVRLALLILISVPFVLIGGVFALPLMGLNLSVSALVGFLALFGVSLQNRVILVERIRELTHRGLEQEEAIMEGALSRVRPVVMTATMATLGLLPAALSTAVGAETSRPFATVIIGGLFFEMIITPFIIPILYPWFPTKPPT